MTVIKKDFRRTSYGAALQPQISWRGHTMPTAKDCPVRTWLPTCLRPSVQMTML